MTSKLIQNYASKVGFSFIEREIFPLLLNPPIRISELNCSLIQVICRDMNIKTKTISSSNLEARGKRAELLLNICKELGAKKYISPIGSKTYLDSFDGFSTTGIQVEYFDFQPREYLQDQHDFISHLSIIDTIGNIGIECSREMLNLK